MKRQQDKFGNWEQFDKLILTTDEICREYKPAAAAKRHITLCGCVHNSILSGQFFDRQYIMAQACSG